jgi:hypothetical protein
MLPQWPAVVWATMVQFPSKRAPVADERAAIADGVEQMIAEAATSATVHIGLPIMGVPLYGLYGFVASIQDTCVVVFVNSVS